MKKFILILFVTIISVAVTQAQHVEISEKKMRIKAESYQGYSSSINGADREIEGVWFKQLRTIGRLRTEGNYLMVREANLNGFGEYSFGLYSKIMAEDSISQVWIGGDISELPEDSIQLINEKLQEFLYEFSLNFYIKKAQEKIKEAERAVEYTSKKYQKLLNAEQELLKDLEAKKLEIIRFQQLLEKNNLEEKVLNQKLIDNKAYQDSTTMDIEHMKNIVEQRKETMKKIE